MKSLLIFVASIASICNANVLQQALQNRITDGEVADYTPYHVTISAENSASEKQLGAGIIITGRHILTVASLIRFQTKWTIGYGGLSLDTLQYATSYFGFIHPLYDATTSAGNIGVIILASPLEAAKNARFNVAPIDFPSMVMQLPRINEEGTIVGLSSDSNGEYFSDSTLQSAYLMVQPKEECTSTADDSFCAFNEYYDANVCHSDVGSAFAIHYRGGIALGGMTTSASNLCGMGDVSTYLRIQSYVPWLEAVTYGSIKIV